MPITRPTLNTPPNMPQGGYRNLVIGQRVRRVWSGTKQDITGTIADSKRERRIGGKVEYLVDWDEYGFAWCHPTNIEPITDELSEFMAGIAAGDYQI